MFRDQRLAREHLRSIADAGFAVVQLDAARTHVDYHHDSALADLQQWLAEAGLTLESVHVPAPQPDRAGPHGPLLLAAADADVRAASLAEAERALFIARRLAFRTLIVHVGSPTSDDAKVRSSRDGACRSLEALAQTATPLGVRIAVEIGAHALDEPGSLVALVDSLRDVADIGIGLDMGRGHLCGDLIDVIETVSEHLCATDVHDNRGRSDDHLVPFEGTIDWAAALTTLQKVGYDGALMFELRAHGPRADVLARARRARQQMDRLLAD